MAFSKKVGIFYVAASRAQSESDIALDFEVTDEDFSSIGTTPSWIQQHQEVERLTNLALQQRQTINPGPFTDDELLSNLTRWICEVTRQRIQTSVVTEHVRATIIECITHWENNNVIN